MASYDDEERTKRGGGERNVDKEGGKRKER